MTKTMKFFLAMWFSSVLLLGTQVYGTLEDRGQIKNSGILKGIGVDVKPTHIEWGEVEPTVTETEAFYATNVGNRPITLLINHMNFTPPEFEKYVYLTHNYTGQAIPAGETQTLLMYLTIDADIPMNITNFNFITVIRGQET